MTTRRVAWRRSDEVETDEHCTLTVRDGGLSLVGTVLGAEDGAPVRIEYRVLADGAGMTTAAHVRDLRGFETRTIALERDAKGNWTVDGVAVKALKGCTDVDLGLQSVDQHVADPPAPARRRCVAEDPGGVASVPGLHGRQGGADVHPPRRIHVPIQERHLRGGPRRSTTTGSSPPTPNGAGRASRWVPTTASRSTRRARRLFSLEVGSAG